MNMPNEIHDSIGGADRNKYRNASSAPAIMRASPFGGWEEQRKSYRGLEGAFKGNVATAHGQKHEDNARALFRKLYPDLILKEPRRVVMGEYAASLDGEVMLEDGLWIVEIKSPYKGRDSKIWQAVDFDSDPLYYFWQVQHQLLCVPEARGAILYVYDSDTDSSVQCEVIRSGFAIAQLKEQWDAFWVWMQTDEPDPNKEGWVLRADDSWFHAAESFKRAKQAHDEAYEALEHARQKLIDLAEAGKEKGCGVSVATVIRKGAVNYKAIPELNGVNLDLYRAKDSEITSVSLTKEK